MAEQQQKVHFITNPNDADSVAWRDQLIAKHGQEDPKDADVICALGGDGSLLYALQDAFNKKAVGLCSTHSNSRGFWMNKVDPENLDLIKFIDQLEPTKLSPLKVKIMHDDGSSALRYAFTDAALMSNNGQASLANVVDLDRPKEQMRVMGNGLTFATPYGSSAKSYAEGGPAVDLTVPAIILTGSGVCSPLNFQSFIYPKDASFYVDITAGRAKRAQRIDLDGSTYEPPKGKGVIGFGLTTSGESTTLLLNRPSRKAFSMLVHEV